ncbi:MAG TPA: ATPase, T2SS/T4P/T4SS family [Opitutaceae bacterium]
MGDNLRTGPNRLIGQALIEHGHLSEAQLHDLLMNQLERKERLGDAAVRQGIMSDAQLAKFLGEFFDLEFVDVSDDDLVDAQAVELVPEAMASRYELIAIRKDGELLTVAMADPLDVRAIDALRVETGFRIRKVIAAREDVKRAIDRWYNDPARLAKSIDTLLAGGEMAADVMIRAAATEDSDELEQLKHLASDAPVVQFVNLLLMRAVQERASDIHIEPTERGAVVRLRVDGQLREITPPHPHMLQAVTTRVKLLGNLDIAERRLPQDGRFKFRVFDKTIDVRLSSLPTVYGEKLVLRILDRASVILDMSSLGFEPAMLDTFKQVLRLPYGLVILTGPTGSGKTTTLYAALNSIKTPTKNIVTIEDPVEYQLEKINQVHTKADIGLTFAAGLRSILRQDPDIIMVGEIRDRETAEICIRAALTGHLVLSTLHTNDAVSAVNRLTDMGIEPYLLTASLSLIMAQRLVRRVCEDCAEPDSPPGEMKNRLTKKVQGGGEWKFKRGRGCKRCGHSGYFSRVAIYEQFLITDRVRELIAKDASAAEVRQAAQHEGLQTLLQSALNKVRAGVTTLDEALSVCATQSDVFDIS